MAINSIDVPGDKTSLNSQDCFQHGNLPASRLVKIDFGTEGTICSSNFKYGKFKKNVECRSPYLGEDGVYTKKMYPKKGANFSSSYPLPIYKANSDEFKAAKTNKKVQKSVLTLPNKPTPVPQSCTVSEMNESEYYNREDNNRKKNKKRTPAVHARKRKARAKDFEFYDRDAQFCSQLDINLDCSSTDTIKKYTGDGKRSSKLNVTSHVGNILAPHDVWAVLRNINRFQFRPSPPISEDSFVMPKKVKRPKRRNNRKDMRVFETRCTEKLTYISSFELDKKSACSVSPSSSFDKVTVIDKQSEFFEVGQEYKEKVTKKKKVGKLQSPRTLNKNTKNKPLAVNPNFAKVDTSTNLKNKHDHLNNGKNSSLVTRPDYRELKDMLGNNIIANQSYEIKRNGDVTSICTRRETPKTGQSNECVYSVNSGSSKAAFYNEMKNNKKDTDNSKALRLNDSDHQIIGITKVVLSNGQDVGQASTPEPLKKSPRQTTTTPNNNVIMPKLTKTEIKRRLNRQKFPIVILNKDQLSSTVVQVMSQEHPQFNGMDKQIWPFMTNWYGLQCTNLFDTKTIDYDQREIGKYEKIEKQLPSNNKNGSKKSKFKEKKTDNDVKNNKVKTDTHNTQKRCPATPAEISNQSQEQGKPKPIRQFKDRMLKLLYKNSSTLNVIDGSRGSNTAMNAIEDNKQTDTRVKVTTENRACSPVKPKSPTSDKRPWAKAKWASDFIENVIKKIRTGAYYTHESKVMNKKKAKDYKEVEIQTASTCDTYADKPKITIPGFDDVLPPLEIKTMNMTEISVKHNVTNIMVYFDVTVPTEAVVSVKNPTSLIPVDVSKSHTKIFKCQTSILNAILPAELCTLLPKMLRHIVQSGDVAFLPVPFDKTSSLLSTITEVTHCESPTDIRSSLKFSMLPHVSMSLELWRLLNGMYLNIDKVSPKLHIIGKKSLVVKYERQLAEELAPHISKGRLIIDYTMSPMISLTVKVQKSTGTPLIASNDRINSSTALKLHSVSDQRLVPSVRPFNFMDLFKSMASYVNNNRASNYTNIIHSTFNNAITINISMRRSLNVQDMCTFNVSNFRLDFPFKGCSNSLTSVNKIRFFTNTTDQTYNVTSNCVENVEYTASSNENKALVSVVPVNNNKARKKSFVKLYKRCRSASYVTAEKTTPLSKITTLDDFFQALGTGKLLAGVFDSKSGHKLMSSIQEMKKWTTEINPRQALLILLLTNKKDTTNILRYRSVLFQGIAVNRITKAHELDMEIEVIERENLHRLSSYEGISYLPASAENEDNLFEELCWIAKTTASDYQKPFDESSEKLLKSLLEKRKKLNPSYLRVMARYVGLGLLKSPGRK